MWSIKLYKQSTYGTAPDNDGIYLFDITFKDPCWHAIISPATLSSNYFNWDLWQPESMTASPMVSSLGLNCGGFYYELEYLSGPLIAAGIDHLSVYTVAEQSG